MSNPNLIAQLKQLHGPGSIARPKDELIQIEPSGQPLSLPARFSGEEIPYTWDIEQHGVTQGVMGTFMLCPKKAEYAVKRGLKPSGYSLSTALDFGDVFHRALDALYSKFMLKSDMLGADEEIEMIMDDIRELDRQKMRDQLRVASQFAEYEILHGTARVLLHKYWDRWSTDVASFDWVDLEATFECRKELETRVEIVGMGPGGNIIRPSIPIRGKFDGVFRSKQGHLWLFETKTKTRIDDTGIIDKLNYDLQVMTYLWAIRETYGETPRGVVYNVVKRPGLRQKVSESLPDFLVRIGDDIESKKSEYFVRFTASITPEELGVWIDGDFKHITEDIYNWAKGDFSYKNSGACNMYNRNCEYMRACAYGDESHLSPRKIRFPELEFEGNKIE